MKLDVLFVICVIFHQGTANHISDVLNGLVSDALERWKQGTDVYMRSLGYEFVWEEFKTGDGVNIKMHHFWKGRNNETGVPVLFQPTLLTNGDVWLTCNPNDCFPHLLANCGYDIWIVNYRGNKYSPYRRENTSYTNDDHIREDLPGAIDHILKRTRRKNLHLISYSKSTLVTFGSLASKPEYNKKVRMHVAMVPVTYTEKPTSSLKVILTVLGLLSQDYTKIPWNSSAFIKAFDANWFFVPLHWDVVAMASQMLFKAFPPLQNLFENTYESHFSFKPTFVDNDYLAMGLYGPLGDVLSHHELYQYGQNICAKKVQSFNYSLVPEEYRKNFSVITYDLSRYTAPTLIFEASQEHFSQPEDYQRIRAQLKNLIGAYRVRLPNYMHIDGLVGRDKNSIYGRAFAYEMLKFDGDEMNSTCHFDFSKEAVNLEKMEVDSVAKSSEPETSVGIVTEVTGFALDWFTKDFCKYYGA